MTSFWRRASPLALALLLITSLAGPTGSPATAAVPTSAGPAVVLAGSGWGHSVGMSQYGARAMAQQGSTAPQILQHYYPGTSVADDARVPNGQQIRVDLYRNRVPSGGTRVDLQSLHATDPDATPTSPVLVDLGDGTNRAIPSSRSWWVSHDPAGARYVLHDGDSEVASGPGPVSVAPGSDSVMAILNLADSASPYIGTYRWGVLSITGPGNGTLNPVLVQPIQNYLWGVAEVPGSWEREVLRAQAITARTYAGRFRDQVISATPANQAYAGYYKELVGGSAWKQAVDDTSGVTVTYQGELAQTYYSSSHGLGRTEASEDSWAYGATIPYLRSVDDPYSAAPGNGNPYTAWTAVASNAEFAALAGLARVNTVRIASRTAGNAPKVLEISGWTQSGEKITCTWSGGAPCAENDASAKGAGATMRLTLPLVEGGASNGRIRSQQISAITLAPFTDDEASVHQFNIGAVAAAGITTGCTTTTYCPTSLVTRGQMATFLGRSLGLAADNGANSFDDIATSPHRGYINALAKAGRIGGYGDGTYRPAQPVSREQMATFLVRAFDVPPAAGEDRFADIADSFHRERINAAAARGLTGGCSTTAYCPNGQVTREQMASFLARAKGLGE